MSVVGLLSKLGIIVQRTYFGKIVILSSAIIGSAFYKQGNQRASFNTFIGQTFFTGVEAIPHITLLALVVGAITILQAVTVMPKIGGGDALGGVMVAVVNRELGPLITALFIAGRTGSAMSTYIGNMRVMQEIDALKAMGINPLHYQIMPSFFATLLSLFGLTMIFNLVAIFGGYFIVWAMMFVIPGIFTAQLSISLFIEKIFVAMSLMDFFIGTLKPLIFGGLISVIACYHGMMVNSDIRDVPRATRATVVRSYVSIIIVDLILAIPIMLQLKDKIMI
ncbi:MAG: ABC transporter permease [Fibrobacteria bacterium]|nr:ABC transporter permease [Fibrobacteria bacterium]